MDVVDGRIALARNMVVDGTYRVERVIGAGGFGITYEAEDVSLGTRVALKEYYPAEFGDRDATLSVHPKSQRHQKVFEWGRSNFLQEARTLARFEHHSIVRVTRVFEANTTAYMVMRYEQGQSFEAWLKSLGRPPTQDELDAIVAPLLDALQLMHTENFLHRDIAPDNIIVHADGSPVLLDFGAARRAVAEMSRTITGIVKPGYSPHEQYSSDNRQQGPWSDIYALGGTLYCAVTGKTPEEAALRVDRDHMPPAAQAAKGHFRPEFLSAIDACLKVRHSERPRSVAQLRPMLLTAGPQAKREPEPLAQTRKSTSRAPQERKLSALRRPAPARRWSAIAAGLLALLGGAYGGIEYMRWLPTATAPVATSVNRPGPSVATRQQADLDAERRHQDEATAAARRQAELDAERRRQDEAAGAQRQAELDAERRRQDEAAAQRQAEIEAEEKRKQDAQIRSATALLSAEERAAYVKRIQAVLKQGRCYDGPIDGRSIDTQSDLDRYVVAAGKNGKILQRLQLALAAPNDFESWLRDADNVRGNVCVPKQPKIEQAKRSPSREWEAEERTPRAAAKAQSNNDRPGRGGTCGSWMYHNTSCTDSAGRRCTQTPGGRKCE
jgi:serine/threonine protein kinase